MHHLKNVLAVVCAATCLLVGSTAYSQPTNVLIIIADDFGADSFPLTASGGTTAPMPNITALKNSGVLFSRTYTHPTCSPTRASILTGRHPYRTGIGAQLTGATSPQLSTTEFTLPDAFAANSSLGYSLAMFGKWHLNAGGGTNDSPRTVGGWPHFAGTISGAIPDFSAWTKITNNASTASTTYATTDLANDVISFITTRPAATPWFAWCAFNAPHTPFHVPPSNLHTYGTPTTNRMMYEAACQALDTEVGRILSNVNLANTHVIFIGDNGTPGQVIQAPYTSAKAKETIYDGGIRVPMIIAGPAVVSPNRTSTTPVHAVDLYSTILEMAGINVSATQPSTQTLDSQSVMSILKNTATAPRYVFSQEFSVDLLPSVAGRALVDAAGYSLLSFNDGREELYNTATDVNQATNLLGTSISATAQSSYAALKTQLASFQAASTPNTPLITSWFTQNSSEYARIYPTLAAQNAQASVTTWSRGSGTQSTPTYSDVQQVDYSSNWIYIHTTGLASHTMGPWYLNAAKTNLFPNYPSNTATKFRFPRTPSFPTNKVLTGLGATGRMVNGVSMFDSRDAFSYSNANGADATPGGAFTGDGIWNRDGYFNEGITFDPALAHQAGNNYHYHAQPLGLRFQLGDHVDYNPTTNVYSESTTPITKHSPIVAWASDGLPVYGPYGYGTPNNPSSAVRRMMSGFVLRNGSNGTTHLANTGRISLPAWGARVQNRSATLTTNQYGPAVSTAFGLGKYIEDFDYLGDLGFTQGTHFDLNEQNVRYCVTPEFPAGTWAYFTTINADNTPAFPYTTGRAFYGDPTGGAVNSIPESVSTAFIGGPFKNETAGALSVNNTSGDVTLTWSAVEGGVYQVRASNDLQSWNALTPNVTAMGDDAASITEPTIAKTQARRFYRTSRSSLSTYDKTGFAGTYFTPLGNPAVVAPGGTATRGTLVDVTITYGGNIPTNVMPTSVTLAGTITGTNFSRPTTTTLKATFVIPANAPLGLQTIFVQFPTPSFTINNALTIN
jgi:arylsulfatase A-like enzyme